MAVTAFSGVRNSWLIFARNSAFAAPVARLLWSPDEAPTRSPCVDASRSPCCAFDFRVIQPSSSHRARRLRWNSQALHPLARKICAQVIA